jgi:protocatechuate 3,4-dioxygenase beta subunit
MNRRIFLQVSAAGAAGCLTGSFPGEAHGQDIVLIPPPYLAPKYVAPANAASDIVIADTTVPGDRFVVTGQALDDRVPVPNASIYAFHADADGFYTRDGLNSDENARLFGTLRTDAEGRYRYETIRPSGYGGLSAHVHHVVTAEGYKPRLFDLWLGDDPVLLRNRQTGRNLPPEMFIRSIARDTRGMWHATHDIPMLREK